MSLTSSMNDIAQSNEKYWELNLSHRVILIAFSVCFYLTNWPSIGMCQCLDVRVQLKIMSNEWSFPYGGERERRDKDMRKERRKGAEMMLLIFAYLMYMRSHLLTHLCTRSVFLFLRRHFQINDIHWQREEKEKRERERETTTNPFRRDRLHEWRTNNDKPLGVIVLLVTNTIEIKERDVQVNWTCHWCDMYTETWEITWSDAIRMSMNTRSFDLHNQTNKKAKKKY